MNHIDLFSYNQSTQSVRLKNTSQHGNGNSRMSEKRPQNLAISRNIHEYKRWKQCKIIGKNISIRSYSAACVFQNRLYIYGGYQILKGMMSDFYCIDLDDNVQKFNWQQIQMQGQVPGPRSKHALVGTKLKIYLIGGLVSNVKSSNQIFQYYPKRNTWKLIKPQGDILPEIDSFGCVFVQSKGAQKIIIICGYDGKNANCLNSVYEYNITTNRLSILFKGTQPKKNIKQYTQNDIIPIPRSGCGCACDGQYIYIFGGKDAENRYNDLWEFSLSDYKYRRLQQKGDIPSERNGHTMSYYDGKLYVFGGIHDITWELDDLHIYNLKINKWTTLEKDSPRKIEHKKVSAEKSTKQKIDRKSPKKINWHESALILSNNRSQNEFLSSPGQKGLSKSIHKDDQVPSPTPGKMIEQQRKKAFLQKKTEMLKNFEIDKKDEDKYLTLETSSQAMKNCLDVIGDPSRKNKNYQGKLTEFGKQSQSKFLLPLQNDSNLIYGKKPCARDGHCTVILNNQLIIFGGDRHQMSFNDIYKLKFEETESR